MAYDDVLTRNENDELSVRVVSATEQSTVANPDDVYTRDTDGNLAVRVVGAGGGGDSHNLGYYETPQALNTAHPTAEAGDWAIVNSTDTVWVWDTDNSAWVDTDTKGQVTSVNNQTGAVVITLTDLGGQEALVSGTNIKSVNGNSLLGSGNLELSTYLPYPNTWTTNSTTAVFCAAIAADTTATAGKAYLGEVTLSDLPESMGNGEVVVEIMDGTTAQNKIIVLTLTNGNTAPYLWKYTYWNGGSNVSGWIGFQPALPSQSGQSGKFLTTNGSSLSWANVQFIQVDTLPTASASLEGKIVQYIGATDYTHTNGYFYQCVSDGQQPATYSWVEKEVQESAVTSVNGHTGAVTLTPSDVGATSMSIPTTMPTLLSASWVANTQTVNVTGVTADNTVFVAPAPASSDDYSASGIVCTAQGAGTLTFTCDTLPSNDITVNVIIFS